MVMQAQQSYKISSLVVLILKQQTSLFLIICLFSTNLLFLII